MSTREVTFDTALRMIDLALHLDQRRSEWAVKDAAETLEVHPKTIRRYVDALGTRLVDDRGTPRLGITYRGKSPYIAVHGPLLSVTPEIFDYASLFFATKLLEFAPKGQLRDALVRISDGLKSHIPSQRHAVIDRFAKKFSVFHAGIHKPADEEQLGDILSGLVNERRLAIRYKNWATAKTLEPLTLAAYHEGLYLIVRKPGGVPFVLSVPLIREVTYLSRERFEPPADWSPETFRGDNFGLLPGTTSDVVLRFDDDLFDYLSSRVFHGSQQVERIRGGGVRLRLRVSDSPELHAWIRSFGPAVVVEEPAALRRRVGESLREAAAQYAGGDQPASSRRRRRSRA